MPQLDVYIICNMLYSVIFVFSLTYMISSNSVLILINILMRLRNLKIFLDKRFIEKILKENFIYLNLNIYHFMFWNKISIFQQLKIILKLKKKKKYESWV